MNTEEKMNPRTLTQISYGVYIITSRMGDKLNGMIATTVCQVTSEPIMITVTVNKQNLTHEFIENSKSFNVSILSKNTAFEFIGQFGFKSGRNFDKFKDVNYKMGVMNSPIVLDNTVGYIEAEVINSVDVGTHTIFIGKVINAQTLNEQEPLTYEYYHQVKGGKSPKTAPTYINDKK